MATRVRRHLLRMQSPALLHQWHDSWTMPDDTAATGKRVEITSPDGTVNKIYFVGRHG